MMAVVPEMNSAEGFDSLFKDLDEAAYSRITSEFFVPGALSLHYHAGDKTDPWSLREARALNRTLRYVRYAKGWGVKSWLAVLAERYKVLAGEKTVCTAAPAAAAAAVAAPAEAAAAGKNAASAAAAAVTGAVAAAGARAAAAIPAGKASPGASAAAAPPKASRGARAEKSGET
jgi:hypothetical protein